MAYLDNKAKGQWFFADWRYLGVIHASINFFHKLEIRCKTHGVDPTPPDPGVFKGWKLSNDSNDFDDLYLIVQAFSLKVCETARVLSMIFPEKVQGLNAFILKISQNKAPTFVNPPGYGELFWWYQAKNLKEVFAHLREEIERWSSWRWDFSMDWKERFAEFEAASYHMNHILFPTQIVVITIGMGWMLQEQGGAMLPLKGTCMVSQSDLNS